MMPNVIPQHDGGTVEEEDYQDSSEAEAPSSGDDSPGAREQMLENMRLFGIGPEAEEEERVLQNQFKASFISHICNVKDKRG